MSSREKLYKSIMTGSKKNLKFDDVKTFLQHNGLKLVRINGSHHIFKHEEFSDIMLDLQPTKEGNAKPYQVGQIRSQVEAILYAIGKEGK